MRALPPTCLAATLLLAATLVGSAGRSRALVPMPNIIPDYDAQWPALERCALASRGSEAELRAIQIRVDRSHRPPRVTYVDPPALPRASALLRCVASVARRVEREMDTHRWPATFTLRPFARLVLPMDPAPAPARRLLDEAEVRAAVDELRGLRDDAARRNALRAREQAHEAFPVSAAPLLVSTFATPDAFDAGMVCRVVHGRGALRAVQRALPRAEASHLRRLTAGACGVALDVP